MSYNCSHTAAGRVPCFEGCHSGPPIPPRPMLDPRLNQLIRNDPLVHHLYTGWLRGAFTAWDAVINMVLDLAKDRDALEEMATDLLANQSPVIIVKRDDFEGLLQNGGRS